MYLSYKIWFLTVRKLCPITRKYHCFTTYMATFADTSFKVRARGELIILYEGTDKNKVCRGKRFRGVRLDTVQKKGQRRKEIVEDQPKR